MLWASAESLQYLLTFDDPESAHLLGFETVDIRAISNVACSRRGSRRVPPTSSRTQSPPRPSPIHTAGVFPWRSGGRVVVCSGPSGRTASLGSSSLDVNRLPLDDIMSFPPLRVTFGEFCRKALCSEVHRCSRPPDAVVFG